MMIHIEFKEGNVERWKNWLISSMRDLLEDQCVETYDENVSIWTLWDGTVVRWWEGDEGQEGG